MNYIYDKSAQRVFLRLAILVPLAVLMAACANIPVGIEQPTAAPTYPPEATTTAIPNTEMPPSPTATGKPSPTRVAPT